LGNGLFWIESKNRYVVIEKLPNGTQRALLLKMGYNPKNGKHPLQITDGIYDQVERTPEGQYMAIDLTSYGVSLKHGGRIPKADGGLKFGTPILGGSYTQGHGIEYIPTPEGGTDFQ
jgi:hypothetical protein